MVLQLNCIVAVLRVCWSDARMKENPVALRHD